MADIQPAIIGFIGTALGGVVAAGTGFIQARTQTKSHERIEDRRLQHERFMADAAQEAADEAQRIERRRALLHAISKSAGHAIMSSSRIDSVTELRSLVYQLDDSAAHDLFEAGSYAALQQHVGRLLQNLDSGQAPSI